jgi:hypothetical protein
MPLHRRSAKALTLTRLSWRLIAVLPQEFVKPRSRMVAMRRSTSRPSQRIDAVAFRHGSQGAHRGGALAPAIGAGEQPFAVPEGDAAQGASLPGPNSGLISERSLLRHPCLAQAGEVCGLGQDTELRRFKPSPSGSLLQAGNARIAIAEPAGFAERDRGAFRLASEGITGRKGRRFDDAAKAETEMTPGLTRLRLVPAGKARNAS